MEEIVRREGGARRVAAFVAEPIYGPGGIIVPPEGYWQRIREICDRYEMILVADEVMTGFGRTGKWFGVQNWDVVPDIMSMAKGVNGGFVPLGVTAMRDWVAEKFENSPYLHGHTYSGHPLAMAAGVASLNIYHAENLIAHSAAMGDYLTGKMHALQEKHPSVGEVRGKGLFCGMELVKSRTTREPIHEALMEPPRPKTAKLKVLAKAMEAGVYIMAGAASVLVLSPPLTVTAEEIDFAMSVVDDASGHRRCRIRGLNRPQRLNLPGPAALLGTGRPRATHVSRELDRAETLETQHQGRCQGIVQEIWDSSRVGRHQFPCR